MNKLFSTFIIIALAMLFLMPVQANVVTQDPACSAYHADAVADLATARQPDPASEWPIFDVLLDDADLVARSITPAPGAFVVPLLYCTASDGQGAKGVTLDASGSPPAGKSPI